MVLKTLFGGIKMNKYHHLKEKAIVFRKKGMSLDDICKRLSMKRGTVYYWIKNTPLSSVTKKQSNSAIAAGKVAHRKFKKLRDEAYDLGLKEYQELTQEQTFRDFIILYLTEGYRRNKNVVSVANSNENIVILSHKWIKKLANPERKMIYSLQCHVDNNEEKLKKYWSNLLEIKTDLIKVIRKSNSGEMSGRNWRSKYGVFTIGIGDTYLRCRLQAWMDLLQKEWN